MASRGVDHRRRPGPAVGSIRTQPPLIAVGHAVLGSQQTHHPLGYVEQLYTFADRDRTRTGHRVVSISYLGLTREAQASAEQGVSWQSWYRYFPWEDHRAGTLALEEQIAARLRSWANTAADAATRRDRQHRIGVTFGHEAALGTRN